MLVVCRELSEIQQIFSMFQSKHEVHLINRPVFQNGLKFFEDALTIDTVKIMEGLENEVKSVRQQLKKMDKEKMVKVKNLLDMLNKEVPTVFSIEIISPDEVLKRAIKSMRKLPMFGCANAKVDFEFPTEKDLLAMPKGKLIKLLKLKWKKSKTQEQGFGALQVFLANG